MGVVFLFLIIHSWELGMYTHIGTAFNDNNILHVLGPDFRTRTCNSILRVDMTIAYVKQNFIYTLETSFLFRQCRHPLIFDAGNPCCWNPRQTFLPFPKLRWAAAMSFAP